MSAKLNNFLNEVGRELANQLRRRQRIQTIEKELIARMDLLPALSMLISGCNRESIPGHNLVRRLPSKGRYVVVLNPIDGHVNYCRGSRLYGGSVSVTDQVTGDHYAVVYDGLYDDVLMFCSSDERTRTTELPSVSTEPVFGLHRTAIHRHSNLWKEGGGSWRSLGSTTLSILEVLRGHIDIYVASTKLWNFYWVLSLGDQVSLYLEDGAERHLVLSMEKELLAHPLATVHLLCYNKKCDASDKLLSF